MALPSLRVSSTEADAGNLVVDVAAHAVLEAYPRAPDGEPSREAELADDDVMQPRRD